MKLYYSNTSPYSRKVRMVMRVHGLEEQIEEQLALPLKNPVELHQANPLGKIPALVLDNGDSLFDSSVICRYLDSISSKPSLFPEGEQKWGSLRTEALVGGMTDAAFNLVMEKLRPASEQSEMWKSRWGNAIQRSLNELEGMAEALGSEIDIGNIATGAAVSYLEFRLPELLSDSKHPNILGWLSRFKSHPFMVATEYHD